MYNIPHEKTGKETEAHRMSGKISGHMAGRQRAEQAKQPAAEPAFAGAGPGAPQIDGALRKFALRVPESIGAASGIVIFGKRIRSFVFTTDVSIIRNVNADAVLAVYPFTPQPRITEAVMLAADIPVFAGVGGGLTQGRRVINLAMFAEMQGACGIVVNAPTSNKVLRALAQTVDIPIVVTALGAQGIEERVKSGAQIINVAAGANTPGTVKEIRAKFPSLPLIATGGPTEESAAANRRRRSKRRHVDPAQHGRDIHRHHGRLSRRQASSLRAHIPAGLRLRLRRRGPCLPPRL
jgi:hypothetical protein